MDNEKLETVIGYVDAMPDSPWIRRILEVAIFGRFSICFSGDREGTGPNWTRIAGEFDLVSYFITPCPCGNLLNPKRSCICSPVRIRAYHEEASTKTARAADLYVEVPASGEGRVSTLSFKEAVARIQSAAFRKLTLSADALKLMRLAQKDFPLSEARRIKTRQAATAIACLEGSSTVEAHHLAEALQYQPRNLF